MAHASKVGRMVINVYIRVCMRVRVYVCMCECVHVCVYILILGSRAVEVNQAARMSTMEIVAMMAM